MTHECGGQNLHRLVALSRHNGWLITVGGTNFDLIFPTKKNYTFCTVIKTSRDHLKNFKEKY